jgi:hypothetical protein
LENLEIRDYLDDLGIFNKTFKNNVEETEYEVVDYIDVVQDRDQWQVLVKLQLP